jgi:tRNA A37 threonylcarbamoyladenosine dehydratase
VDPALVQVADLTAVHHDRLLMFTRKLLRKYHGFTPRGRKVFGVPAVFSPEPVREGLACDVDTKEEAEGEADARLACDGRLGAATFVTGVFGFFAAARVINDLASPGGAPNPER